MNAEVFLEVLNDIDNRYVEHTGKLRTNTHISKFWVKWVVAAACFLLMTGVAIFTHTGKKENTVIDEMTSDTEELFQALSIQVDSMPVEYYEAGDATREEYGLPETISENDLGDVLGVVSKSLNAALVGKNVYYYKNFPKKKNICILDTGIEGNNRFLWYYAYGYTLHIPPDSTLAEVFSIYGLPECCESVSVFYAIYDVGETLLYRITDKDQIMNLLDLLLNGVSVKGNELKQRAADLWKETYGNDQYRLNEKGDLVFFPEGEGKFITESDSEGNDFITFYWPERDLLEKQVYELCNENMRILEIENTEGFKFSVIIQPKLRSMAAFDGGFDVPEEAMEELVQFLQTRR